MKTITCAEAIMKEFDINSGMKTAEMLKQREGFNKWALNTIKSSLSKLKKEKKLMIGFRTRGSSIIYTKKLSDVPLKKGKCYYKLVD